MSSTDITNSDDEFDDAFDRFTDDYEITPDMTFTDVKRNFREWQGVVRGTVSWKQHKQIKRKYEEYKLFKDITSAIKEIIKIGGKVREVFRDPFTGRFTKGGS